MAEERNRTTGMRWVTAARATRIASISGSTLSRLIVRALVAATVKPAKATVYANSRTLIARNGSMRFLCVSSLCAPHSHQTELGGIHCLSSSPVIPRGSEHEEGASADTAPTRGLISSDD